MGAGQVELADLKLVEHYAEDLRNLLSESSLAEQKAFIRGFIKEIRVTNREADLFYTIPLPHDRLAHDRAEVLSIVQLGRPCRSRTCDTLIKRYRPITPLGYETCHRTRCCGMLLLETRRPSEQEVD